MGLEDIRKKILEDANLKKDALLKQAGDKKAEIIAQYTKKSLDYSQVLMDKTNSDAAGLKNGIIIDAKLKLKNEILRKKREILEESIDRAKTEFISRPEYPVVMKSMVSKAAESKSGVIVVSRLEKTLDQNWLNTLNKETGGKFTLAGNGEGFSGGLLLVNGDISINLTIEALLEEYREGLEKDLADTLFK